jgi:hypothetical protein
MSNYSFTITENSISKLIDKETLNKIEKHTTLSLFDLILPSVNYRTDKIPRPQNKYIIYRRDLCAKLALSNSTLTFVNFSKFSSNNWKKESSEVKNIFDRLAEYAKVLHNRIYPNYKYSPKKQAAICNKFFQPQSVNTQTSSNYLPFHYESSKLPLILEVNPNSMELFNNSICKKLNNPLNYFFLKNC